MPCDPYKRSQRKYYKYAPTLEDVVNEGNVTSRGSYFDGDLEASGYLKGHVDDWYHWYSNRGHTLCIHYGHSHTVTRW